MELEVKLWILHRNMGTDVIYSVINVLTYVRNKS